MSAAAPRRRLSSTGLAFMAIGLCLVFYEFQTSFMQNRAGWWGHLLILFVGTTLSVWGLKEVVARYWPRLAGRGDHFLLPREGFVYLAIMCVLFIGAIQARNNLQLMVFSVMIGPWIVNGGFAYSMLRGLRVRRELPERVMAGETFEATIVLENPKSWLAAWVMTVHDAATHGTEHLLAEVLFFRVPPRSERAGCYRLRPQSRGRYEFRQLEVTTRFPMGLLQRGVGLEIRQQVLVYPRLGRLHPAWRRLLQHSMELASHVRPTAGAFQDEMHRIREYRPGDDRRLIHWRTSARMNELMVCEYQETRDRNLSIVVDAWLPRPATTEQRDTLERALSFAATVATEYLRHSRQSSLDVQLWGKKRVAWRGDAGEPQADELLDALALLEPSTRSEPDDLVRSLDREHGRQQRILLITTRWQQLQNALARLETGRGLDLHIYGARPEDLQGVFEEIASDGDSAAALALHNLRPAPALDSELPHYGN